MIMSLILSDTFLQKYFSIDFINTKEEKLEARNLIGYQVVSKKEYFNNFMQINTLQSNTVFRFHIPHATYLFVRNLGWLL